MGGQRNNLTELRKIIPDPYGQTAGLVPTVSTYVDDRGLTQYIYTLQAVAPGSAQAKIQFQYNGANLGTSGSVDTYNVVSSTATFVRAGNTVTLTIPAGLASPLTTKGDIWGFSTLNARVPVGADGTVLTADSTQPLGVKWGTGGSYTPPVTTKGDLFGFSTVPARVPVGANGTLLTPDSTQTLGVRYANLNAGLSFRIGRQDGAVLLAGFKRTFIIPCAYDQLTTGSWELYTFPGSTCSIDIQTIAFGSTDPTTGNSIVGGIQPATSGGQTATGVTSGWTASLSRGAFIAIQVLSNDLAREIRFFMPGRKVL